MRVTGIAMTVALVLACVEVAAAQQVAEFSDHWVLNTELSDAPRAKLREAMQQGGGGGRGGGGRGGAGGGRGGAGGGGGGQRGGSGGQRGGGMFEMFAGTAELIVVQAADEVSIKRQDGVERVVQLAASESVAKAVDGVRGYWSGAALVIETSREPGPGVSERYELVDGERRMVVTVQLQLPMLSEPVSIRRVYDAAQ